MGVTRNGGTMADVGSVQRMFARKGVVTIAKQQGGRELSEDDVMEAALEAGLEEVEDAGDNWEAMSDPNDVVEVRKAVEAAGLEYESAEVQFVASFDTTVTDVDTAKKVFNIIDALEDSDDVQNVFTNIDLAPEVEAALDAED